jgi:SpoVK/Ycf46/Vps4 family AAA+-type ATPase
MKLINFYVQIVFLSFGISVLALNEGQSDLPIKFKYKTIPVSKFQNLQTENSNLESPRAVHSQNESLSPKFNSSKKSPGIIEHEFVGEMPFHIRKILRYLSDSHYRYLCANYNLAPRFNFLLHGPPGTGKTFLASKLAESAAVPYTIVKIPEILSPEVNRTEAKVLKLFTSAKLQAAADPSGFSILILDEVDSLLVDRTASPNNPWYSAVTNTFLQLLDNKDYYNVIVIMITNNTALIDPAAIRSGRIGDAIFIDLPDSKKRYELLGYFMKFHNEAFAAISEDDLLELVNLTDGFNVADLKLLVEQTLEQKLIDASSKIVVSLIDIKNQLAIQLKKTPHKAKNFARL